MRFLGNVYRDDRHWLAEVPVFDAMTQGRTRREALEMIEDWFVTMINRPGFSVRTDLTGRNEFVVSSDDLRSMISLLLRRQRHRSGLSLAEAAERLGVESRNAYARYERGDSLPTIEKLDQLLEATAPGRDLLVTQAGTR